MSEREVFDMGCSYPEIYADGPRRSVDAVRGKPSGWFFFNGASSRACTERSSAEW
jgi:hypothetical protein